MYHKNVLICGILLTIFSCCLAKAINNQPSVSLKAKRNNNENIMTKLGDIDELRVLSKRNADSETAKTEDLNNESVSTNKNETVTQAPTTLKIEEPTKVEEKKPEEVTTTIATTEKVEEATKKKEPETTKAQETTEVPKTQAAGTTKDPNDVYEEVFTDPTTTLNPNIEYEEVYEDELTSTRDPNYEYEEIYEDEFRATTTLNPNVDYVDYYDDEITTTTLDPSEYEEVYELYDEFTTKTTAKPTTTTADPEDEAAEETLVKLGAIVTLSCGFESTRNDRFIKWEKLNGVSLIFLFAISVIKHKFFTY